jgi:hypothetical protein
LMAAREEFGEDAAAGFSGGSVEGDVHGEFSEAMFAVG